MLSGYRHIERERGRERRKKTVNALVVDNENRAEEKERAI